MVQDAKIGPMEAPCKLKMKCSIADNSMQIKWTALNLVNHMSIQIIPIETENCKDYWRYSKYSLFSLLGHMLTPTFDLNKV